MNPTQDSNGAVLAPSTVRRVFSVNVPERDLAIYMENMAMMHPRGMSGWIRGLVTADRAEWIKRASVRERALRKLTEEERAALGYPPNTTMSCTAPKEKP